MFKRFDKQWLKDLPGKVDIVDYVSNSGYELKKTGKDFGGLCPFHNEKSPSFSVVPEKQFFHCFGCGAHGNVLDWAQEYKHLDFVEAVKDVAQFAGVPIVEEVQGNAPVAREEDAIYALLEKAQRIYTRQLANSPAATAYLESRGLTKETVEKFGIGYAPDGNFIQRVMKDAPVDLLVKSGLIYESEYTAGKKIDRLRDRLVFPIKNSSGKIIAFSGRVMTADKVPNKYINFGETALFKKGTEAYGLYESKTAIRKANTAIVTEGYMDVVMPHQHGVENIVAAMGTTLSASALGRIYKNAEHIVFCFDGDKAGMRAAVRAMESVVDIADERHKASFVFFPDGMDPDEYIRKHGAEKFHDFVSKGMPLSKFIIQHFSSLNDMEIAEGRAKFVVDAMDLVSKIKAPILRHIVADEVRKTVGYHIPLGGLNIPLAQPVEQAPAPAPAPTPRRGFPTLGSDDEAQSPPVTPATSPRPISPSYGLRVLALLLEDPEAARNFDPRWIQTQPTTDEEMRAVTAVVDRVRSVRSEVTPEFIRNQFKDSEFAPLLQQATDTISQDQYAEMHELLNFVQYQQARMEVFKAKIRKNLPKPT